MQEDIAALNRGQSRQEVLSNEVQTGVADVAEVDRTAELLLWLMDSFFGGVRLAWAWLHPHHQVASAKTQGLQRGQPEKCVLNGGTPHAFLADHMPFQPLRRSFCFVTTLQPGKEKRSKEPTDIKSPQQPGKQLWLKVGECLYKAHATFHIAISQCCRGCNVWHGLLLGRAGGV